MLVPAEVDVRVRAKLGRRHARIAILLHHRTSASARARVRSFVLCPLSGLIGETERDAGEPVATPDMNRHRFVRVIIATGPAAARRDCGRGS